MSQADCTDLARVSLRAMMVFVEMHYVFLLIKDVTVSLFSHLSSSLCWLWAVRIAEKQSSRCVLTGLLTNQMIFTWKHDSKLHETVPENT